MFLVVLSSFFICRKKRIFLEKKNTIKKSENYSSENVTLLIFEILSHQSRAIIIFNFLSIRTIHKILHWGVTFVLTLFQRLDMKKVGDFGRH